MFVFLPQLGVSCGAPPLTDHGAYVDYLGQVTMEIITVFIVTLRLRQNSRHFLKGIVKIILRMTRRCVYVDLFIHASILAPTKVPVATGIETLSSTPVVYRDAVRLMSQYGKPTDTTLIYL